MNSCSITVPALTVRKGITRLKQVKKTRKMSIEYEIWLKVKWTQNNQVYSVYGYLIARACQRPFIVIVLEKINKLHIHPLQHWDC